MKGRASWLTARGFPVPADYAKFNPPHAHHEMCSMRLVVDSNSLQSEELRKYLSKSTKNFAVLTDYASMEAYKGDTLVSIYRSMEILSLFPKQVIILNTTTRVCGLKGRSKGLQRRLIDESQTRGFAEYCRHLRMAKLGNVSLQNQLLEKGRTATVQMDRILTDVADLPAIIDDIAQIYTEAERRIIRTGSPYTGQMVGKITQGIMTLAAGMFETHPKVIERPRLNELSNTFIFRTALCAYLLALRWIAVGTATNTKPERMRNDMVDINFAAFATYFDGLLSADKKLNRIYQEAVFLLRSAFITRLSERSADETRA